MFRKILKPEYFSGFLLPAEWFNFQDQLKNETKTEKNADISIVKSESGWDRVKQMYEVDEFGDLTKELITIIHVGAMSLFVGAIYGGIQYSKVAYIDFIKNNQHTAFNDHLHAKKKLQDKVTMSFGKGAFRWGWRLGLFCTSFVGISTTISVYRGKTSILEYVVAGGITGSMYKFSMGPRGWLVGGGLGSVLGLFCGATTLGLLKLTGMSMDEVRYWQYHWRRERDDYFNKGAAAYLAKEEGELMKMHNEKLGEDGKKLDNSLDRLEKK